MLITETQYNVIEMSPIFFLIIILEVLIEKMGILESFGRNGA